MHTGTQRKDVSRTDGCPARGAGGKISPIRLYGFLYKKVFVVVLPEAGKPYILKT